MSQNVTLSTTISPAQALALQTLVSGGSVTQAAKEAGVARETVSRWVHHDPVFLAQLQNVRAELAIQTRCALEALGIQAVGVLANAVQDQFRPGFVSLGDWTPPSCGSTILHAEELLLKGHGGSPWTRSNEYGASKHVA
jgi:hypothetical protein